MGKNLKNYYVQIKVTDGLISFKVGADNLENALASGKQQLKELEIFGQGFDVIDYTAEVTGVYE